MAKLVLSRSGSVVFQCFLDTTRIGVGRDPVNQIVVDEPAVSAEHAAIIAVGKDHILEDLNTLHGTPVNGRAVRRHILQHGDIIQFGVYDLRYLNPRASDEAALDRTILIPGIKSHPAEPDARGAPGEEVRLPAARSARVRFPAGRIRITAGKRAGRTIVLDRVVAIVGKPGYAVAVLTRRPQGFFITHVEGRFPRVNRQTLDKEAHLLRSGDVIEVADEQLEFVLG